MVMAAAVSGMVSGCVTPSNDRVTTGHGPRGAKMEAFTADSGRAGRRDAPAPQSSAGPSLQGISRDNWTATTYLVPVDGTAHRPTYTRRVIGTNSAARQRREMPTADTALELTQGSGNDQALEALLQQGNAALDVVLLPIRLVWQPPWTTMWSPDESAARFPSSRPRPAAGKDEASKSFGPPKAVPVTP